MSPVKKLSAALLIFALATGTAWLVVAAPKPACAQAGCVATFCGYSSECPGDCVCAIPMGDATGYCTGTR